MSDEDILARLTDGWIPIESFFLIGTPDRQSVAIWVPENGVMVSMNDDAELAAAYKRLLRNRNAREFASARDVYKAACEERWPNWEKFSES